MTYEFTKRADKELQKLPLELQRRIIKKIKFYLASENPLHFAKPLENESEKIYRFRIGTYRIIFELKKDMVSVLKIAHRKESYKK